MSLTARPHARRQRRACRAEALRAKVRASARRSCSTSLCCLLAAMASRCRACEASSATAHRSTHRCASLWSARSCMASTRALARCASRARRRHPTSTPCLTCRRRRACPRAAHPRTWRRERRGEHSKRSQLDAAPSPP
eukprot:1491205-Rhodomonas_salina.3